MDDEINVINYSRWLWRVAGWDLLLPAIVFAAPILAKLFNPIDDINCAFCLIFVAIPIFILRSFVGCVAIAHNRCGGIVRGLQRTCLFAVALWLLMADAGGIAVQGLGGVAELLAMQGIALAASLPFMIFAMYPGSERQLMVSGANICGRCGVPLGTSASYLCKKCERN